MIVRHPRGGRLIVDVNARSRETTTRQLQGRSRGARRLRDVSHTGRINALALSNTTRLPVSDAWPMLASWTHLFTLTPPPSPCLGPGPYTSVEASAYFRNEHGSLGEEWYATVP
jgi:hypothetical protein